MPAVNEVKEQALETIDGAGEITARGSMGLVIGGIVVAYGDFIEHVGHEALHLWLPERINKAHELFDVVGVYGLKTVGVGFAGVIGGVLVSRATDRLRGIQE